MSENSPATSPEDTNTAKVNSADGKMKEVAKTQEAPRKFLTKRLMFVGLLAAVITGVAQWFAPTFDYQNANMITIAAAAIFVLYTLFVLHRFASSHGQRITVPVGAFAVFVAFVIFFRHDGFSGEMVPQFSWRFGSQRHAPLQEAPLPTTPADANELGAVESPDAIALANSVQFLGPNRNGVINERLFSVPNSDADVKILWNQTIGEGWSAFAIHEDRAVTLEQRDDQECVSCYRLSDGKLLWIDEHKARHEQALGGVGPRSTPTIADGTVFAMGAMGLLRVLDLQTGQRMWTKDFLSEAGWTEEEFLAAVPWGHASSPLLIPSSDADASSTVVLSFGGPVDRDAMDADGMTSTSKSLIAMDATSGDVLWKAGQDQLSYASPMLMTFADTSQIVSVNEKTITGHEIRTGKTLWSHSWPGSTNTSANCASAIPLAGDRLVIGKGYSGGSMVVKIILDHMGEWQAESEWSAGRVLQTKFNHTCVAGDIGFGLSNGTLQAVDLNTGESQWLQSRRERFGQGHVVLVDDALVAQTEAGDVVFVAADADRYRELGRLDALSSKTWNIPTIAGRHLIVRNDRQAICYLLPAK